MRVKGQHADLPRQPSTVAESCSFRLRQSTRQQDRGQLTIHSLLFARWKLQRETGQTPAGPSHGEKPRRPAAPAAHDVGKKFRSFFSLLCTGLELVKHVWLSIQVWTLDRVLLCSHPGHHNSSWSLCHDPPNPAVASGTRASLHSQDFVQLTL